MRDCMPLEEMRDLALEINLRRKAQVAEEKLRTIIEGRSWACSYGGWRVDFETILQRAGVPVDKCPVLAVNTVNLENWCDWRGSSIFSDIPGTCKQDRYECRLIDCWRAATKAVAEAPDKD